MFKSVLQTLPFIAGMVGISLIVIWLALNFFGFGAAEAPVVTKVVGP
jgi:nitric oxide reductase large subunit